MIYILCPANITTGGPELLHQLGYKLRLFGFDVSIFYYERKENKSPVSEQYQKALASFRLTGSVVFQQIFNTAGQYLG